jgi:DNA-binding NarL/FixJ family response regulator
VLVVDQHRIAREGLCARLRRDGFAIVGEARTGAEAVALAGCEEPDAVVLDLDLPDARGGDACRQILEAAPRAALIALSAVEDKELVAAAFAAGAAGCLAKDAEDLDLTGAIVRARRGETVIDSTTARLLVRKVIEKEDTGPGLSEQEIKILRLAAEGCTNREIGERLYLSRYTVKEYMSSAMRKLHVRSRVEAVLQASQLGLIERPRDLR